MKPKRAHYVRHRGRLVRVKDPQWFTFRRRELVSHRRVGCPEYFDVSDAMTGEILTLGDWNTRNDAMFEGRVRSWLKL